MAAIVLTTTTAPTAAALAAEALTTTTSIVTGANGYVGRAVVQELLASSSRAGDKQRIVVCLVRPPRVASETEYWKQYCATKNDGGISSSSIRVLPYDMLDHGATLAEALRVAAAAASSLADDNHENDDTRCSCTIYHIASVFGPTENHQQTALDNVQGTEELVLTLAKQQQQANKNDCKLVLLSSMAAVRATGQAPRNGQYYTSEDWNTSSQLGGANWGASYQWSKAESERRAWALCREHGIPMVSLCPSFVFGPPVKMPESSSSSSSYSLTLVGEWARGVSPVQSRLFVDVRDVARATVQAGCRPTAVGKRYLVSTEARVPSPTIAGWIQEELLRGRSSRRLDAAAAPEKIYYDADFTGGAIAIGEREVEATEILREELGISLRDVKETITDMVQVLIDKKL